MDGLEQPSAEGTLRETPLVHQWVYMLDRELTGSLVLIETDGTKHRVDLEAGLPVKARLGRPVHRFGDVLVDLGLATPEDIERALASTTSEAGWIGQALVAQGTIDDETLRSALGVQLFRKLLMLGSLPGDTRFQYFNESAGLAGFGAPKRVQCDPLAVILASSRRLPDEIVDAALARVHDVQLTVQPSIDLRRFGFTKEEQSVADLLLEKPTTLAEVANTGAKARAIAVVVYTFLITRHFQLGEARPPVGADVRVPTESLPPPRPSIRPSLRPPASRKPPMSGRPSAPPEAGAVGARRRALEALMRTAQSGTLYDLLGVPSTAKDAEIRSAYFGLAKELHPDRQPPGGESLKPLLSGLLARVNAAFTTLTDADRRRRYDESITAGVDSAAEREKVQQVVRAAMDFQKAEVLAKKRNFPGALELAQAAVAADPEQSSYEVLLIWIEAQMRSQVEGTLGKERFRDLIVRLTKVIEAEEENEKALYYRGVLLKRDNRIRDAMKDFRAVVQINPGHLEAMREVRVFEIQRRSGAPAGGGSSIPPASSSKTLSIPPMPSEPKEGLFRRIFKR